MAEKDVPEGVDTNRKYVKDTRDGIKQTKRTMATKKELRAQYKQLRRELPSGKAAELSAAVGQAVVRSREFRSATTVHLFLPIRRQGEIDTFPILGEIFRRGKTAVVSVSDFSTGDLAHYRLHREDPLAENRFGIPEPLHPEALERVLPESVDLILVPLLAYDAQGTRVGYGRGFYDRFLRCCRPDAVKAGLSFFPPCAGPIDDATPEDVPLDVCFTPQGKITCRRPKIQAGENTPRGGFS